MRNNSKERCNHTIYPCLECKSEVVKKIYEDIKHIDKDEIKRKRIEEQFIESANERVKKFINQTIFMS
jgi:GMP synthase PP-ATPase subunit